MWIVGGLKSQFLCKSFDLLSKLIVDVLAEFRMMSLHGVNVVFGLYQLIPEKLFLFNEFCPLFLAIWSTAFVLIELLLNSIFQSRVVLSELLYFPFFVGFVLIVFGPLFLELEL